MNDHHGFTIGFEFLYDSNLMRVMEYRQHYEDLICELQDGRKRFISSAWLSRMLDYSQSIPVVNYCKKNG